MQFEPLVGPDKSVYAVLNTDELEINKDGKFTEFLTFNVSTYNKLGNIKYNQQSGSLGWEYVFGYVNRFFNTLSDSDKTFIAKAYAVIKKSANDYQEEGNIYKISDLIKKIAGVLAELDLTINLCPKLSEFVDTYVPIGYMANAGNRPQDRPELTFYKDDVRAVTTITVLCKMLCPIFGTIIHITKKFINSNLKEIHCACILTGIIENRYKDQTEKLKYYIEHVTKQIHKEDTASALVYGYDMNSLAYHLYCQLLVRQLVNVDLSVKDSNLMSYIIVSAKRSIVTIQNNVSSTPTKDRTAITSASDDDGNIAQLETDSMTSKKTSDLDALVSSAVLPTIRIVKNQYGIEDHEYDECMKYYQVMTLWPSPLNEQLNSLIYGKAFGGSLGIKMLKFNEFSMITVLTQMILFQHDADPAYKTLAHLVTAKPSIATMVAQDELNDNIIWLQVSASTAYRNCKQRFMNSTVSIKNKEWENHIQNIIKDITIHHYVYNTAPFLWDWLGQENLNGKTIPIDRTTLVAYCAFYDWFMSVNEESMRVAVQ